MSFTKISNAELNSRGATTLPNQPTISASALKAEFDAPAKNVVAPKVNNLIDELEASTSAASLGAVAPTGRTGTTVQGVINSISSDLATAEGSAHTHSNKTQLDKISEDSDGNPLYDGNPIGSGAAWGDITGTLPSQTDLQSALNGKANSSHSHTKSDITDFPALATVATSGSYNDLSNKPSLATVATSGSYSDLSNKPTIPDELSDLTGDVSITSTPSDGDVLTYETSSSKWKAKAASGGASDTFKNIVSAGTTFTASGSNDTFKINAGSNVTIEALSSPDKGIKISASGGGQSTGDMLMSDYDPNSTVKNTTGGIVGYVTAQIGALDYSDSAVSGKYVSQVTETDGKIAVTRADLPTVPTVSDSYDGTSGNAMSGKAVKQALETLDVSDSAVSGQYVSAVSETDGKITVTRANLPTVPTVSLDHNGSASTTNVRKQRVAVGETYYDVDGSVYMESTANSASFVFTNSTYIFSTKAIDVYTDTWGDNPSSVVVDGSLHTCTVTFSAAASRTVRIYIK